MHFSTWNVDASQILSRQELAEVLPLQPFGHAPLRQGAAGNSPMALGLLAWPRYTCGHC